MKTLIALLMMIATVTGCALPPAYETLRAKPISDSFTSTKPLAEMVSCIYHGWAVIDGSRRVMDTAPLPNGQIVYTDVGTSAAEITATQGVTLVKIYAGEWYRERIVTIARKCK